MSAGSSWGNGSHEIVGEGVSFGEGAAVVRMGSDGRFADGQ